MKLSAKEKRALERERDHISRLLVASDEGTIKLGPKYVEDLLERRKEIFNQLHKEK